MELLERMSSSEYPVDCIVYDAFMAWSLDVAKKFGIFGAVFFTQSCAVGNIYYHAYKGLLKLPLANDDCEILIPGLQLPLEAVDLPSFCTILGRILLCITWLLVSSLMLTRLIGFSITHSMSWKKK